VERQTEPHHKVERMIGYTREHIIVLQSIFGIFLGIGAHVRYAKSKSEQERVARKKAKTITTNLTAGLSDGEGLARPRTPLKTIPVLSPVTNIVTVPVTLDVRINNLAQLPEEAKVNDKDVVAKYVHRGLEGATLLYEWASHRLTLRVGYNTSILSETDDNLFAVFKTIVDELCPQGDGVNENYPETGKHIFSKTKCMMFCILMEATQLKYRPLYATMIHCLYPRICAVALCLSSKKNYVVPKSVIPLQASVPCLSAAVATSNYNLVFNFKFTFL
jgi:hypothetical protein